MSWTGKPSLEVGMGRYEPTDEEREKLAKLKEANDRRKARPPEERRPPVRSDRFYGPIGADAEGNVHTDPPDGKRDQKR